MYECSRCHEMVELELLAGRGAGKTRTWCKRCEARRSKESRARKAGKADAPPARVRQYNQRPLLPPPRKTLRGREAPKLYRNYTVAARRRGLAFELTYDEFESICLRACSYCGQPPKERATAKIPVNGVDRVDSSAGYTLENCVPCCRSCNRLKGTMSVEEFLETLHRICDYMSKTAKPAD